MFKKDVNQHILDLNLRLMDVVKEQQKTIDRLSDKLMAKNLPEYYAMQGELPLTRPPVEENPHRDIDDLTAEEGSKLLDGQS